MENIGGLWILQFLGSLHPLVVHFPIGILVVALFLEVLTINGRRPGLHQGISWLVYLGTLSAIVAAGFGWSLLHVEEYSGKLIEQHRILGFLTAGLAMLTSGTLYLTQQTILKTRVVYRIMLILSVVVLTWAGHLGARLTHGDLFRSLKSTPQTEMTLSNGETTEFMHQIQSQDSLSESQLDQLNLQVRQIFAHNCYQCHSENKQKADLVLENKEGVFRGGKSGKVIVSGRPQESELFRRITLSPDHDQVMPKKGKVLKPDEIALIELWIAEGAHWSERSIQVFPEAPLALDKPDLPDSPENHPIDKFIDQYFKQQQIKWPKPVDDRKFMRRAYLDIIGLLPPPKDILAFSANQDKYKREKLIEDLLNNQKGYTEHWLSFWNDLLRNDYSGTGFITGGRMQITEWLYQSLYENKPYDLLVKELVDPTPMSAGFINGIRWRGTVNASQTPEMQAAQNVGQALLGVNVKCASCHNSFVSNMTLQQAYNFAAIFADSTLELYRCDEPTGKMAQAAFLYPEVGTINADSVSDRLEQLAEVMIRPENGRLYRTIINRIWDRLLGRGLIEPVDEMDNPSWNQDLLDWLASEFIDEGYDLKQLIGKIMTSKAYQLPAVAYGKREDIISPKYIFAGPVIRRLSAEQFADAVSLAIHPVYETLTYNPKGTSLSPNRVWHREIKFDRDVLPEPGKRYFRAKVSISDDAFLSATALISVDHAYTLYINGQQMSQGSDWRKVDRLDVSNILRSGENIIAVEAMNEGNVANPAGILFSIQLVFPNRTELFEQHTEKLKWKSIDRTPRDHWIDLAFDDREWAQVRNYGSSHWDHLIHYTFEEPDISFARASLVRQDPFMKALGRPTRENVTTTRDDQATLLQALELTNGTFFNDVLEEGAEVLLQQYEHTDTLIENLYHKALGRDPTRSEKRLVINTLGEMPQVEGIQDLLWSIVLLPEFQFIY